MMIDALHGLGTDAADEQCVEMGVRQVVKRAWTKWRQNDRIKVSFLAFSTNQCT